MKATTIAFNSRSAATNVVTSTKVAPVLRPKQPIESCSRSRLRLHSFLGAGFWLDVTDQTAKNLRMRHPRTGRATN